MKQDRREAWLWAGFLALVGAILIGVCSIGHCTDFPACGGTVSTPGTYTLAADRHCSGPGIVVSGSNIILDLNGHTIFYDEAVSGVANPGFESGTGTVADNWDVSGCNGHCLRRSNANFAAVELWRMNFEGAVANDSMSATATMPAATTCGVSFLIEDRFVYWYKTAFPTGPRFRIKVYDPSGAAMLHNATDGTVGQQFNNNGCTLQSDCPGLPLVPILGSQGTFTGSDPWKFTSTTAGTYKITLVWESVPTGPNQFQIPLYIDQLNMTTVQTMGIRVSSGTNITVQNGTITQTGVGLYNHCINSLVSGLVTNMTLTTNGIASCPFSSTGGPNSNSVTISGNNVNMLAPQKIVIRRTDLDTNAISIVGGNAHQVLNNVIVTTGGGITISGGAHGGSAAGSLIQGNTINSTDQSTNHYGINVFAASSVACSLNTITITRGQGGIDFSWGDAGAENNAKINHNTINLVGMAPIGDFGSWQDCDGIRINGYQSTSNNLLVERNTVNISGDADPFYTGTYAVNADVLPPPNANTPGGNGSGKVMWGIVNNSYGTNVLFNRNIININLSDSKVMAMGMILGSTGPECAVPSAYWTYWTNNEIHSNRRGIGTGGYATGKGNNHFVENMLIEKIYPIVGTWKTLNSWREGSAQINQVRFVHPTFIGTGGAAPSLAPGECYINTAARPYDYTLDWHLTVNGSDGTTVRAVSHSTSFASPFGPIVDVTGTITGGQLILTLPQEHRAGKCFNSTPPVDITLQSPPNNHLIAPACKNHCQSCIEPPSCHSCSPSGCQPPCLEAETCGVQNPPAFETDNPYTISINGQVFDSNFVMNQDKTINLGCPDFTQTGGMTVVLNDSATTGPGLTHGISTVAAAPGDTLSLALTLTGPYSITGFRAGIYVEENPYGTPIIDPIAFHGDIIGGQRVALVDPTGSGRSLDDGCGDCSQLFATGHPVRGVKWVQWAGSAVDVTGGVEVARIRFRAKNPGTSNVYWGCQGPEIVAYTNPSGNRIFTTTGGGFTVTGRGTFTQTTVGDITVLNPKFIGPTGGSTVTGTWDPCTVWSGRPNAAPCSEYAVKVGDAAGAPGFPLTVPIKVWGERLTAGTIQIAYPNGATFNGKSNVRSGWTVVITDTVAVSGGNYINCPAFITPQAPDQGDGMKKLKIKFCQAAGASEDLTGQSITSLTFTAPYSIQPYHLVADCNSAIPQDPGSCVQFVDASQQQLTFDNGNWFQSQEIGPWQTVPRLINVLHEAGYRRFGIIEGGSVTFQ